MTNRPLKITWSLCLFLQAIFSRTPLAAPHISAPLIFRNRNFKRRNVSCLESTPSILELDSALFSTWDHVSDVIIQKLNKSSNFPIYVKVREICYVPGRTDKCPKNWQTTRFRFSMFSEEDPYAPCKLRKHTTPMAVPPQYPPSFAHWFLICWNLCLRASNFKISGADSFTTHNQRRHPGSSNRRVPFQKASLPPSQKKRNHTLFPQMLDAFTSFQFSNFLERTTTPL